MIETIVQDPFPVSSLGSSQYNVRFRIITSAFDLREVNHIFEVLETKCYYWVVNVSSIVITISKSH